MQSKDIFASTMIK